MLGIFGYFELMAVISLVILGILWLILAGFILITPLRLSLVTLPFLRWFQRENPPLSLAEQQVINAGGAWWGNELFTGHPDWQILLAQNPPGINCC